MRILLTTRCARKAEILNSLDIYAEMFAQHFMGGVKFLRTKDWEERLVLLRKGEASMYLEKLLPLLEMSDEVDVLLDELESLVADDFDRLVKDMIGKIIQF